MILALAPALAACGRQQPFLLTNTEIGGQAVSDILSRLRQDIGLYNEQARARRALPVDPDTLDEQGRPIALACGIRNVDFDITKAEITLQVSTASKANGEFGLKVPFGPAGVNSIGPDLTGTSSGTATQTLTFDLFDGVRIGSTSPSLTPTLKAAREASVASGGQSGGSPTPIADTLIRLRKALIDSARTTPCFDTISHDRNDTASDTIKIDFVIERDSKADVSFNIVIVSASAGIEKDRTNQNTLTVNFAPIAAKSTRPR
jgi:hypothetical protein